MTDFTVRHRRSIALTSEYDAHPTIHAEYIGAGRYCKAYRSGSDVYLLCPGRDYAKEIASSLPVMMHLPECEFVGWLGDRRIYKMPYYRKLAAANRKAWTQFRRIEAALAEAWSSHMDPNPRHRINQGYDISITVRDLLSGTPLGRAVGAIADTCVDYGASWTLEIAQRNCGVGRSGNLVLRDAWFDAEEIADAIAKRRREAHYRN